MSLWYRKYYILSVNAHKFNFSAIYKLIITTPTHDQDLQKETKASHSVSNSPPKYVNLSINFDYWSHEQHYITPKLLFKCSFHRHATISWGKSVFFQWKSVSIRILHLCIDVSRKRSRDPYRDAVWKKISTLCNKNRQPAAKTQNRSFISRGATVWLASVMIRPAPLLPF